MTTSPGRRTSRASTRPPTRSGPSPDCDRDLRRGAWAGRELLALPLDPLLPDGATAELRHDIEVTEVAGVILEKMEQNPLKGGRLGTVPAGSRSTDTGQVVVLDDCPAANRLGLQGSKEILSGLLGCDAPPVASLVTPRLVHLTAIEAPLKPAQLDEGEVLDQLQRSPS